MAVRTEEARGEVAHKLHRDVSTIGLLFVCLGSVIGSGWLFGALYASQIAGPASIISWVLGALVMLVLALVHAELGSMYPVAGARPGTLTSLSGTSLGSRPGGSCGSEPSRWRPSRSWPRCST
jgi:amino acid transporter